MADAPEFNMTPLLSFFGRTLFLRAVANYRAVCVKLVVAGIMCASFIFVSAKSAKERANLEKEIRDSGADVVRLFWYAPPEHVPNNLSDFAGRDAVVFSAMAMRCVDEKEQSLPVVLLDPQTVRRLGVDENAPLLFVRDTKAGDVGSAELRLDGASLHAVVADNATLRTALPYDRALLLPKLAKDARVQSHCAAILPAHPGDAAAVRAHSAMLAAVAPKGVIVKDGSELLERMARLVSEQRKTQGFIALGISALLAMVFASYAELEFVAKAHSSAILRELGARPVLLAVMELVEPAVILALALFIPLRIGAVTPAGFAFSAGEWQCLGGAAGAVLLVLFVNQWRMMSRPVGLLIK